MDTLSEVLVLLFGVAICIALLYIMISVNKIRKSLWEVRLQTYKVVLGNALICYKNGYDLPKFIDTLSKKCENLTEEDLIALMSDDADDESSNDKS